MMGVLEARGRVGGFGCSSACARARKAVIGGNWAGFSSARWSMLDLPRYRHSKAMWLADGYYIQYRIACAGVWLSGPHDRGTQ